MAGTKEILDRIGSIGETMKVTNAMYLISSSKIRKARERMNEVKAYYDAICSTIGDILALTPDIENHYLEKKLKTAEDKQKEAKARRGYLVITADKGLAGAYNINIIRRTEAELKEHPDSELFIIGQVGLHTLQESLLPSGTILYIPHRIPRSSEHVILRLISY